jgi:RHS repeat-associated protein
MKNETGHRDIDKGLSKLGEGDVVYTFGQMRYLTGNGNTEDGLYFYHGNHLSSTQVITNLFGNITQQVLYAPFGEVITEHNAYWHNGLVPDYLFNAKELDEESGMYYYEARYYAPPTFISRDPLFEMYPTISPYAYCNNNPVKYIDPDGKEIVIVVGNKSYKYDGVGLVDKYGIDYMPLKGSYEYKVLNDLKKLANSKHKIIRERLNDLVKSEHVHKIENTANGDYNAPDPPGTGGASNPKTGSGSRTYYNPDRKKFGEEYLDGTLYSSTGVLAHELLGHGWDNNYGLRSKEETNNGILMNEVNAVNIENLIYGELKLNKRTKYKGETIPTDLLDTYFTEKPVIE